MRYLALATITIALADPASAASVRYLAIMPPAQYDVPYTGTLRIWRVASGKDLLTYYCPTANTRVGCAHPWPKFNSCDIYIVNDILIKAHNTIFSVVLRHELGHCNGWPAAHPNPRRLDAEHPLEMPLPAGTQTLRAYPPLVCLTPDGKEESCQERSKLLPSLPPNITVLKVRVNR
jgi:hypothetical protein